jgi:hypothetical protein
MIYIMQPETEAIRATLSHDVWLIGQWGIWTLIALGGCLLSFMVINSVRCRPVWELRFVKNLLADAVREPRHDRRAARKDRRVGLKDRRVGLKDRRARWLGGPNLMRLGITPR